MPEFWAIMQVNLAWALESANGREPSRQRLERVIDAYRAALEVLSAGDAGNSPFVKAVRSNLDKALKQLRS